MKLAALVLVLAACGGGHPGGLPFGDGGGVGGGSDGGSGVAAQGLTVQGADGRDFGVLLDIDEDSGVWKVYNTNDRIVFYVDPRTGIIGSRFDIIYYGGHGCTGPAYIAIGGGAQCAAAREGATAPRVLAVLGGDLYGMQLGQGMFVSNGDLRTRSIASMRLARDGGMACEAITLVKCGASADSLEFPAMLPAPLTLLSN